MKYTNDQLLNVITSILIKKNGGEVYFSRDEIRQEYKSLSMDGKFSILVFEAKKKIVFKTVSLEEIEAGIKKSLLKQKLGQPLAPVDEAFLCFLEERREALHAEHYGCPN